MSLKTPITGWFDRHGEATIPVFHAHTVWSKVGLSKEDECLIMLLVADQNTLPTCFDSGGAHQNRGSQAVRNGASFLDILTNRTRVCTDDDVLVLDPVISSLTSFIGRAVVGRAQGLQELRSIKSSLVSAGFTGASCQYLGGLSVLIAFENEVLSSKFFQEKESWSRWFSSLSPWIGQALPYECQAWINILGVPPHLVSSSVFDLIGSKYGKVVQPSQFLESDGDLSFDRMGVLIDSGVRINGVLNLSWQDKRYKVWVFEDYDNWIPDFLDDDSASVAGSSELGEAPPVPSVGEGRDLETIEVESPEENPVNIENPNVLHVPMQGGYHCGGSVSTEKDAQDIGEMNDCSFFNSPVGPSLFQNRDSDNCTQLNFTMGRPNNVKPKKSKRFFLKNSRPSSCINGAEHGSQEHRPKKRSRSCLEGGCNSGDHVNTGGSGDKGFDKGGYGESQSGEYGASS
ncbi:hypothetical protein Hanom_Chr10g00928821 [Helianthus anomalus]